MTGYMFAMGPCIGCGRIFSFNPHKVPSIRIPADGDRQPICRDCVARANPMRAKNGLPPIPVLPDAYEAAEEG